jgi:hypothetical protein
MVKKKGGKKSKNGAFKQDPNPSPNVTQYSGPVILPAGKQEADLHTVNLMSPVALTSSGAGVLDAIITDDPSGYSDWASFAALFHEYRVLAMEATFVPNNRYDTTAVKPHVPFMFVSDREGSTVLGGYANALNHPSCVIGNTSDKKIFIRVNMSNAKEAQFTTVGTPTAKHWIKYYANGLAFTAPYGQIFVRLLIQFRGRT